MVLAAERDRPDGAFDGVGVEIERLGAAAEAVTLQFLDDELQPLDLALQLRFSRGSESIGLPGWEVVDVRCINRGNA